MCDGVWLNIETAPKDGTMVRLKRVYENCVVAEGRGYFGSATIRYAPEDGGPKEYHDIWATEDRAHFFPTPTHWMPLPSAPHPPAPEEDV